MYKTTGSLLSIVTTWQTTLAIMTDKNFDMSLDAPHVYHNLTFMWGWYYKL